MECPYSGRSHFNKFTSFKTLKVKAWQDFFFGQEKFILAN